MNLEIILGVVMFTVIVTALVAVIRPRQTCQQWRRQY